MILATILSIVSLTVISGCIWQLIAAERLDECPHELDW